MTLTFELELEKKPVDFKSIETLKCHNEYLAPQMKAFKYIINLISVSKYNKNK